MIFPSTRCSITCAAQPVVRAITKSGVNMAVGTPNAFARYTGCDATGCVMAMLRDDFTHR
jgi:hypothetical protein